MQVWIDTFRARFAPKAARIVMACNPRSWSPAQRRFLIIEALLCVALAPITYLGASYLREHYWIGYDPSEMSCLPWRVAIVEKVAPGSVTPTVNETHPVVFPAKHMEPYVPDGTPIAKLIVGRPGDTVSISAEGVTVTNLSGSAKLYGYVDPVAIARADEKRGIPAGRPRRSTESFYRTLQVEPGKVFLMGAQPTSQDGRYFGTRDFADIRGVVRYAF